MSEKQQKAVYAMLAQTAEKAGDESKKDGEKEKEDEKKEEITS